MLQTDIIYGAKNYDRNLTDIFEVQDEISNIIQTAQRKPLFYHKG
jgi:TolB-like protein